MAHGKSYRMQHSDSGLLRQLCLLCLLTSMTACMAPRVPADDAAMPAPAEQAPPAPSAKEALPPAQEVAAPGVPPPGTVEQPPVTRPESNAWSGLGGLFGNLGKLGGAAIGAGHAKAKAAPPAKAHADSGATQVTVYYATDRQYQPERNNYGWQPNRAAPYLSYGSVQVSIPDKRAPGELPLPPWYAILAGDDAQKYVLLQGVTRLSRADFLAAVQARIRAAPERHAAFIYIHGYSNSFDDAARRTAQMAVDLDIGALPVFYSWPSKGTFAGYEFDENSAEWTQTHLQAFLADFADTRPPPISTSSPTAWATAP